MKNSQMLSVWVVMTIDLLDLVKVHTSLVFKHQDSTSTLSDSTIYIFSNYQEKIFEAVKKKIPIGVPEFHST